MTNTPGPGPAPTAVEPVPVRLHGGPACWHGKTLTIYTRADIYDVPFEALGTYLTVPDGSQLPPRDEDEDENPRAHYAPAPGGDRTVWHFVSWVPWSPNDPAPEDYLTA